MHRAVNQSLDKSPETWISIVAKLHRYKPSDNRHKHYITTQIHGTRLPRCKYVRLTNTSTAEGYPDGTRLYSTAVGYCWITESAPLQDEDKDDHVGWMISLWLPWRPQICPRSAKRGSNITRCPHWQHTFWLSQKSCLLKFASGSNITTNNHQFTITCKKQLLPVRQLDQNMKLYR